MTTRAKKAHTKKRPKKPSLKSSELPANAKQPGLPPAHVGRAVKNCVCPSCRTHRRLDRQVRSDATHAALFDLAFGSLSVTVSVTATDALRDTLGVE
jgi:hypothetical protein